MLTGQRREEVAGLCWSEVDFDRSLWTLPGERTKNGLPHEVPLSKLALRILGEQPRRLGDGKIQRDLIFGRGKGPFSGWSRSKVRLDEALSAGGDQEKKLISNWRIHDLRRTMVTIMAERLSILPHVIESVVNHVSGHKAGVAGIYNRATYAKEKRLALQTWADYLDDIVKT
jgi:integrase